MTLEQQRAIAKAKARQRMAAGTPMPNVQLPRQAAFDPGFESERAQNVASQEYGTNIDLVGAKLERGMPVTQQDLIATRGAVGEFDRRQNIAESGVELNTPFPTSSVGMGFSENKAMAAEKALTDHFAEQGLSDARKAEVRYGPTSEKLEWKDPETDVWHIANPDMMSKAGYAIPAAFDVAGTVIGGVLGGFPGEIVGSTVSTGTGEIIRLAIGRAAGYNDATTPEMLRAGVEQGLLAGAATLTIGGAVVTAEALKKFIRGGGFTKKGAMDAGIDEKAADAIVAEIKKILDEGGSPEKFLPTTAQRAQTTYGEADIALGSLEANLRHNRKYAREFAERDAANQAALTSALDVTSAPYTQIMGPTMPADAASQAIRAGVDKRVTQAKSIFNESDRTLEQTLNAIDSRLPQTSGKDIRPVIEAKRNASLDAIEEVNKEWRGLTKYNPDTGLTGIDIQVPKSVKNLKKQLAREQKDAIADATKTRSGVLSGDKDAYDLTDFNIALSDMKRVVRNAERSGNPNNIDIGNTKRAIGVLQKARNDGLVNAGRQDVLDALLKAESDRLAHAELYERSIAGNVLEMSGDSYKVLDKDILNRVITSGPESVDSLIRAVGDSPQAMNALREGIYGLYKRQVVNAKGIPLMSKHKEFMASYEPVLEKFFTKTQRDQMKGLGKMGQVVEKQQKQLARIIKNGEQVWGRGKLTSLDPDKMLEFVFKDTQGSALKTPFGGFDVGKPIRKIKWLKNRLKNHPAALEGLKANYAQQLRDSVVRDGVIHPNSLKKMLQNEDLIREFMGGKYVKNLKAISDGMNVANRKFSVLTDPESLDKIIVQSLRGTVVAPLSKRGRRLTASILFFKRKNHEIIKRALLNPEELEKIAKVTADSPITRRTLELAGSLGLVFPTSSDIENSAGMFYQEPRGTPESETNDAMKYRSNSR